MSPPTDITFPCPSCTASLSVPPSSAGVAGPCPYCNVSIVAPIPDENRPVRLLADDPAPPSTSPPRSGAAPARENANPQEPNPIGFAPPEPPDLDKNKPLKSSSPNRRLLTGGLLGILFAAAIAAAAAYFFGLGSADNMSFTTPPSNSNPSTGTTAPDTSPLAAHDAAPPPPPIIAGTEAPPGPEAALAPEVAMEPNPEPPVDPVAAPAPEVTEPAQPATPPLALDPPEAGLLDGPRTALLKFLHASDWVERARYVQNPDHTLAEMESYYVDRDDGPIDVTSITFQNSERVPEGDRSFYVFHITTTDVPDGFPVSVEETNDGFRVDWQACVEFMDLHLSEFLANYQEAPANFHVILRRTHYFDDSIPDIDKLYAFRIEPPIPGNEGYAFLPKNAPLAEGKHSYILRWDNISYFVITLQWVETKSGARYVTLKDIVHTNWRADPPAASAAR